MRHTGLNNGPEVATGFMLRGRNVQQIYELHGQGQSIRAIARILGLSRNSVRKYLRSDEIPRESLAQSRLPSSTPLRSTLASVSRMGWTPASCSSESSACAAPLAGSLS